MTNDRHDYPEFGPLAHRRMLDPELFPLPDDTRKGPREVPAALRGPAWQPQQTAVYEQAATQWNGEPCQAIRVTAVVKDNRAFPGYWARDLAGTRRNVVQVLYGGDTFYLDDEDGSGWHKVTHGGGPRLPHRNLTVDPLTVRLLAASAASFGLADGGVVGIAPFDMPLVVAPELPSETVELSPSREEPSDTCRPVEVDGETIRVHGAGEFTEREQEFVADVVRAGRRLFAEESLTTDASPLREHIAEALFNADGQVGPYRTVHSDTKDEYRRLADAVLAVVLPHGKFLGDRVHDVEEQLLAARAEAERWIAFIQRGMDTHMQFSVLRPDGTAEQLPCADWCYACRIEQAEVFTAAVAELIAEHEGDEWASHPATTALRTLFTDPARRSSVDDSGSEAGELVHPAREQQVSAPPTVGDRFRLQPDGRWTAAVAGGTLTMTADTSSERRERLLSFLNTFTEASQVTADQARIDSGRPGAP